MTSWRTNARTIAVPCIVFGCIIVTWEVASYNSWANPVFLPSPVQVAFALWKDLLSGQLLGHIGASMLRVFGAFFAATIVAVPIGALMGRSRVFGEPIEAIVGFVRYVPVPVLVPLFILWFGIGELQKAVVIFTGTFFQLVVLVRDGVISIPREYFQLAYTLGASRSDTIRTVLMPAIAPKLYDDLRVTLGWAWSYLVVAEIVAASSGIGFYVMQAQRFVQTPRVIGGIIVIGLLGLILDLVFRSLRRAVIPWQSPAVTHAEN